MQTERQVATNHETSHPTWPVKLGVLRLAATIHIYHRHLLLLLSQKADTHLPSHGGWKAELTYRHCSKGVQPVPKAVYHSGCRDKHNSPR